ncbi:hypothetical protein OK016_08885 [Vibrio chagasii]|nr:hypothetical protein [Vibrio chagasii]
MRINDEVSNTLSGVNIFSPMGKLEPFHCSMHQRSDTSRVEWNNRYNIADCRLQAMHHLAISFKRLTLPRFLTLLALPS